MARVRLDLQAVVKAGAELANTEGIEALTLATLSQKLSIRSPSLYNHVNGLSDLRNQLVLYGNRQLKEVISQASIGKSKDDAIRAIADAYRDFARQNPGVYEAICRYQDMTVSNIKEAAGQVLEVGLQVLQAYDLQGDMAIHIMRALRSMIHGFVSLEQQEGYQIPLDPNVSFHMMVDIFLAGIHNLNEFN